MAPWGWSPLWSETCRGNKNLDRLLMCFIKYWNVHELVTVNTAKMRWSQHIFWCRCIQTEITTRLTSFKHLLFMVNDSKWKADSSAVLMSASSLMPVALVKLIINCRSILGNPLTHNNCREDVYATQHIRLGFMKFHQMSHTWMKCILHI